MVSSINLQLANRMPKNRASETYMNLLPIFGPNLRSVGLKLSFNRAPNDDADGNSRFSFKLGKNTKNKY